MPSGRRLYASLSQARTCQQFICTANPSHRLLGGPHFARTVVSQSPHLFKYLLDHERRITIRESSFEVVRPWANISVDVLSPSFIPVLFLTVYFISILLFYDIFTHFLPTLGNGEIGG
jgi:hypothetical protein